MKWIMESLMGTVNNNEDYRRVVKAKNKMMIGLIILGVLMLVLSVLAATYIPGLHRPDFLSGLYAGGGSGFIAVAIVNLWRARKLLNNEELLRKDRLKKYDERTVTISQKSLQSAGMLVFWVVAVGTLIGGMFSMIIFWCFWGILILFAVAFILFNIHYNKMM